MAWIAVNKDGSETIFAFRPYRKDPDISRCKLWEPEYWSDENSSEYDNEDTFGIENLVLSFRELIKTYENACEIIEVMPEIDCDSKSELARLKLIRIYEASNVLNHWKFAPLKAQLGFYPSFILEKGKIVFHEMCSNIISFSSDPKLCCGSKEDAYYIGTHFIDLYRDYLLPE